ncbi:hypothetical protein FGADI_4982 [Fusarium gaditjirri]|uniref:RING-type domain-containing protein n=1 Tax=Fusarium gaditjirri TaxID=282569 RepID=A0A8H4TBD8_9HYPO|nr:hypothetical protein FGADI_4982 [Fusarium gaditjirri]
MSSLRGPITSTFYPELASIINFDPTALQRLELDCGMCRDRMSNPEDRACDILILPCGHMFCSSCIEECREHERAHKCPVCRFDLAHKICGCPIEEDIVFKPTPEQDHTVLVKMQAEISRLRGTCDACDVGTLVHGFRQVALFLHDPAQLIKDGHILRVTIRKCGDEEGLLSEMNKAVTQLPVSSDLQELFNIARDSLDMAHNGPLVEDEPPLFSLELALCKQCPENHCGDHCRFRRGEMELVKKKLETPGCDRLALAREAAESLAKSFASDEACKQYRSELKKIHDEEAALLEALELSENNQDHQDDQSNRYHETFRLYALAAIPVAAGIVAGGWQFGVFLARNA